MYRSITVVLCCLGIVVGTLRFSWAWRHRPIVVWDPAMKRWRAARAVTRSKSRQR